MYLIISVGSKLIAFADLSSSCCDGDGVVGCELFDCAWKFDFEHK